MELHSIKAETNKFKKKRIVGRGIGSRKGGHTVGRGMNGQRSRSGGSKNPRKDFEGGQNPISRRLPKLRGFKSTKLHAEVKLSSLNAFENGTIITIESLFEKKLISAKVMASLTTVKIIAGGELTSTGLKLDGVKCSKSLESLFS